MADSLQNREWEMRGLNDYSHALYAADPTPYNKYMADK